MKTLFITLALVTISACGTKDDSKTDSAGCSSQIVGTWTGVSAKDSISLGSDQTFKYTGADGCSSKGTFVCPDNVTQGTVKVTISSASASAYCSPAGDYVCGFNIANSQMAYQCQNSAGKIGAAFTYKK